MTRFGRPVVNIDEAPLRASAHGDNFEAWLGRIGSLIGVRKLGCQYHVVPAGKRAFPLHAHHANEEMFFVVSGEGSYRFGTEIFPIRTGDVIAAPSGDASTAHQIVNTSDAELRYLGFSTRLDPDVVEYPDSGKFSVASMVPENTGLKGARIFHMARPGTSIDYWDGEN